MKVKENKPSISHLRIPKNKQKLNALLKVYRIYKDFIGHYLEEPTSQSADELNVFYMRELVPKIQTLAKDLKLDPTITGSEIKLPSNYILFPELFGSEKILQDAGKDAKHARVEAFAIYGQIKQLVEKVLAVDQTPIPEVENIITKARMLMSPSQIQQTAPNNLPRFLFKNGWWCISIGRKSTRLGKAKTIRGELLDALNDGVIRRKDVVYEILKEKLRKDITCYQITNVTKEINRTLKENDMPPLKLWDRGDTWQFIFKHTKKHTV